MKKFAAAVLLLAVGCQAVDERVGYQALRQCSVAKIEGCKFAVCMDGNVIASIAPYGQCSPADNGGSR
jgi:hypothetical protein